MRRQSHSAQLAPAPWFKLNTITTIVSGFPPNTEVNRLVLQGDWYRGGFWYGTTTVYIVPLLEDTTNQTWPGPNLRPSQEHNQ
uniref:Lipoprotein n=1 Tax=Loa loa TaxID=7209 RepID=A0A1I7W021_LOALO